MYTIPSMHNKEQLFKKIIISCIGLKFVSIYNNDIIIINYNYLSNASWLRKLIILSYCLCIIIYYIFT